MNSKLLEKKKLIATFDRVIGYASWGRHVHQEEMLVRILPGYQVSRKLHAMYHNNNRICLQSTNFWLKLMKFF